MSSHSTDTLRGRAPRAGRMSGFTLVEVTVAGFVLTIASVGLAVTLAQGAALSKNPRSEITARHAMQAVLAEIQSTTFAEVGTRFHNVGFPVADLKAVPGDADGLPGEVVFGYGPEGDTSYYTVTVRVRWQVGGGERVVESVRYVSNMRGDTGTPSPLAGVEQPPTSPRGGGYGAGG